LARLAASRTFCTAGNSSAIKMPIMAITTNSSIKVKARRVAFGSFIQSDFPAAVSIITIL